LPDAFRHFLIVLRDMASAPLDPSHDRTEDHHSLQRRMAICDVW
jgi:hypothetical protein